MKLYHNPRCQKSREALKILQDKGLEPQLVLYMKEPLLPTELQELLDKLDMQAEELVRTKENIWKGASKIIPKKFKSCKREL